MGWPAAARQAWPMTKSIMRHSRLGGWAAAQLLGFALTLAAPVMAAAQPLEFKGIISSREGDKLTVTAPDGTPTVVHLSPTTRVVSISGALKLQRSDAAQADLLNGLPINVEAVRTGDQIDASSISFKSGDLKTARQIDAGTAQAKARVREKAAELEAQNAELKKRMAEANQYVEKAQATVLFASGSTTLTAAGKQELMEIANRARTIKGYLISVVGYADPTGNPEANQKLSERRAAAVIAYLQKYGGVMPQRVLAGDAMGDAHQVGDTSTPSGLAQNRRVVVKVLTNKGLEGLG
jgi:OOP family OmpA-OmpF porin